LLAIASCGVTLCGAPAEDDSPVKRQQVTDPVTPESSIDTLGAPVATPTVAVSPPSLAKTASPGVAVNYELLPAAGSVVFSVKLVVPKAAAGAVIGKGGDFINSLRTVSGARIALSESMLDKPDLDRVVRFPPKLCMERPAVPPDFTLLFCGYGGQATLTGQFMQIMNAFKPILEKLVAHQDPPAEVPGHCSVKLQLTNEQAGCLIGKGGAVISGIRAGAGVSVHIDSHKDAAVLVPVVVRCP
jgi:predicted RNA-binding protein YlqC (UPF0109 family)